MGYAVIHRKKEQLNKEKLDAILSTKKMNYTELYNRTIEKHGLDLSLKGFMNLLSNRVSWKYLYAWAIADVLEVDTEDIIDIVEINAEEKAREKKCVKKRKKRDNLPLF